MTNTGWSDVVFECPQAERMKVAAVTFYWSFTCLTFLDEKNINFIRRRNLIETSPVSVVWHSRLSELFVLCNKTRIKCSNSSEACQWRCSIVLRLPYHFIALGGVHSSSADVLRYFACSREPTDDADDGVLHCTVRRRPP